MYSAILTNIENSEKTRVVLSSCKRFVLCLEPSKVWNNVHGFTEHAQFKNMLVSDAPIYWLPVRVHSDYVNNVLCTRHLVGNFADLNTLYCDIHKLNFTGFSHVETRKCTHLYDNGSIKVFSICQGTHDEDEQTKYNGLYLGMVDGGMLECDVRVNTRVHYEKVGMLNGLLLDSAWLRGEL